MKKVILSGLILFGFFSSDSVRAQSQSNRGYIPYWYADQKTTTHLDIVNRSATPERVRVVGLVEGTHRRLLEEIVLQPKELRRIPLTPEQFPGRLPSSRLPRWGTGDRHGSVWGSLVIHGNSEVLGAWVVMNNPSESVSTTSMMSDRGRGASELVAHWFRPTSSTTAIFAVQNVSDQATILSASILNGHDSPSVAIGLLERGETQLVTLADLAGNHRNVLAKSGAIRFTSSVPGALAGRATMVDARRGFSTPLMMHAPKQSIGTSLQSPGVPFRAPDPDSGFRPGTFFRPQLMVTNQSNSRHSFQLSLQADFQEGESPSYETLPVDGSGQEFEMRRISDWDKRTVRRLSLDPGETRVLDIVKLTSGWQVFSEHVAVRLDAKTAPPGTFVTDLVTTDETLWYSMFDPMFDTGIETPRHLAVSLDLSNNKRGQLYFNNASDELGGADVRIWFESAPGEWHSYQATVDLAKQEFRMLDITQLRNDQIPDSLGNLLPLDMTKCFAESRSSPHVVSADPSIDLEHGTCWSCDDTSTPDHCIQLEELVLLPLVSSDTMVWPNIHDYRGTDSCGNTVTWTIFSEPGDVIPRVVKFPRIREMCSQTGIHCFRDPSRSALFCL